MLNALQNPPIQSCTLPKTPKKTVLCVCVYVLMHYACVYALLRCVAYVHGKS